MVGTQMTWIAILVYRMKALAIVYRSNDNGVGSVAASQDYDDMSHTIARSALSYESRSGVLDGVRIEAAFRGSTPWSGWRRRDSSIFLKSDTA